MGPKGPMRLVTLGLRFWGVLGLAAGLVPPLGRRPSALGKGQARPYTTI
jgi:hypothetical protein